MMDLTSNEKDKKEYIVKILLTDNKSFKILYADGHVEEKAFDTVHNYNVYLHHMKEQYYRYEKDVTQNMVAWIKDSVFKGLVEFVLALEAIIITSHVVEPGLLQTAIIVLTILFSLGYLGSKFKNLVGATSILDYLNRVDKFIGIQEKLKVPVTDPKTGRKDDWYMFNLSDVNLMTDVDEYEKYAMILQNEEVKEEEGAMLSKVLKGE